MEMHPEIVRIKAKEERSKRDWEKSKAEIEARHQKVKDWWKQHGHRLRPASPEEYICWLHKYVNSGGKITHYYDYKMTDTFFVAVTAFNTPAFYGSESINIIVPDSILVYFGDYGHNNIYQMEPVKAFGGIVPCYQDTEF